MSENEKNVDSLAVLRAAHGEGFDINISVSVTYSNNAVETAEKRTKELLEDVKGVLF